MKGIRTFVASLAVLSGCAAWTPAGFWTTYRHDLISMEFSDQGPWGGARWALWTSAAPGTFKAPDVMGFANAHGWSCVAAGSEGIPRAREFPRHISGPSAVYSCKTGWMRVAPGSGTATDALGYVQINESGTEMAMYHLWGED
jgi:hypothetical protein